MGKLDLFILMWVFDFSVSTVDESPWVWLSVAFLFFADCLNQIATIDTALTKVALSHGGTRDGQRLDFGPGLILALSRRISLRTFYGGRTVAKKKKKKKAAKRKAAPKRKKKAVKK